MDKKECEVCGILHNSKYGSGRFCTEICARSYSTKGKRLEINDKIKLKLPKKERICIFCKNKFTPKNKWNKTCSDICTKNARSNYYGHDKVDWSDINKKSYRTGKNFASGGTTKWLSYKNIKVQGTYEYKMCEILDLMVENNEILSWVYSAIRIPYIGIDNKEHTYIVDFLVNSLKSKYLIEVKGREVPNDILKWEATRKLGWDLRIYRKSDIFKK